MSRSLLLLTVPTLLTLAPATSRAGFGDPIGNFNIRWYYLAGDGGGLPLAPAAAQSLFGLDACKVRLAAYQLKNHDLRAVFAVACASADGPQPFVLEETGQAHGLVGDPEAGQIDLVVNKATADFLGGDELLDVLARIHDPANGWSTFPQDVTQFGTIALE
jgi:hypothetical protein